VFLLAVPYLLNPAGIVLLVTAPAEAASVAVVAVVVGHLIVILALDIVVFRWAVQVSSHLDANRMLVTEKVFGFLLAARAPVALQIPARPPGSWNGSWRPLRAPSAAPSCSHRCKPSPIPGSNPHRSPDRTVLGN